MKKAIAALCLALALSLSIVSCGRSNDDNSGTDTTKNDGMITETGTDTNIVDRARSMVNGVESDMMGMR